MKGFKYIVAGLIFIFSCSSQKSEKKNILKDSNSVDVSLFIVDTIDINDPILIRFEEKRNGRNISTQLVLVSKSSLDSSIFNNNEVSFQDFFSSRGYLFFTANSFSCLINNLFYDFPTLKDRPLYTQLQDDLRNSEKDNVWVKFDKEKDTPKEYYGWRYHEILPRKFLFCLVKGSALKKCQSIDETIITDLDNVYFKVLTPIGSGIRQKEKEADK